MVFKSNNKTEFKIDRLSKDETTGRDIGISVTTNGFQYTGLPLLSLDEIIDLRKALRKYIINAKKKRK